MASIQERSPGHFRITVSCGSHYDGRKRMESTTYIADSSLTPKQQRNAAKAYAQEFEAKIRNSTTLDGRHQTLEAFSQKWLHDYAEIHLQPKTVEKYREELKGKILPKLGQKRLSELSPSILNSFLVSLTKNGARADGKSGGYSKSSIVKTKNVLSSVLRTAVEWELLEKNPCEKVRPPAVEQMSHTIKFFTPEQTIRFLQFVENPYTVHIREQDRIDDTGKPYHVNAYEMQRRFPLQTILMFELAVYTGLRKGELLALKFSDIDCENCIVHITKSVTTLDGQQICKAPKTKSSVRSVSIPHSLVDRVLELQEERKKVQNFWGADWHGENWVFITENGRMMNYGTPYHALQDAIQHYNDTHDKDDQLPTIPFHGLRHTSATLLISAKQDIATVSKRLGHAHTSVTLDIYTHALEENDYSAADALENILQQNAKSPVEKA